MSHRLAIEGQGFTLDGAPFDMWGARLANALETDAITAALVRELDDYVRHGVNTFSVFLQGGSTGSANPFDADGSFTRNTRREESSALLKGRGDLDGVATRNQHLDRLALLIEEAGARAMAVNVGVFYQARIRQLCGERALLAAARQTAHWLVGKGYGNVFVDLVNEYGHPGFEGVPLCYGRAKRYAADGGEELLTAFHEKAPGLPASISAVGPEPVVFANADLVLIHHPFSPKSTRARAGRDMPVVLNEWGFGVVLPRDDTLAGLYTPRECELWQQTIAAMRSEGGFVFFHSSWKQRLTDQGGPYFELGPEGAQPQEPRGGPPSDHWYFDLVAGARGLGSPGKR
jgi:hypothetical protein